MTDPARTKARTYLDRRRRARDQCKVTPCQPVLDKLAGKKGLEPPCIVCIYEVRLTKSRKGQSCCDT